MNVTVLGSGSAGNAFAISAAGVTLLIDAGFGPRKLAQRAATAGLALDTIVGIVLTHEHGDHTRGARSIAKKHRCPVYASRGTLYALQRRLGTVDRVPVEPHKSWSIGPFTLTACRTSHDAAEPIALVVEGPCRSARVGIAYDFGRPTAQLRHLLRNATCLIVEANHDEVMLRTGPYPPVVRDRIAGSAGHLSNRAAGQLLADLYHPNLRSVVLVHLSEKCNTAETAEREVTTHLRKTAFRGELRVARQDEPLAPFRVAPDVGQLELGFGA